MKILELFKGTGSFGKVCNETDTIISVDILKKYNPTHLTDIQDFDYKQYDNFDFIWSSPPCCNYSQLQNTWIGRKKRIKGQLILFTKEQLYKNIKKSNKIVEKAFEIIDYFSNINPQLKWCVENPNTSKLKNQEIMKDKSYVICSYCMYGFDYKKNTRIWNNFNLKLQLCNKKCKAWTGKKHSKDVSIDYGGCNNRDLRFRIPNKLCQDIYNQI